MKLQISEICIEATMREKESNHFLSHAFTDLMASLAVIFILLTVVFIKSAAESSKREKQAVQAGLSEVLV